MSLTKFYRDISDIDSYLADAFLNTKASSSLKGSLIETIPDTYHKISADKTSQTVHVMLPGFTKEQLTITPKTDHLVIASNFSKDATDKPEYLRSFSSKLHISAKHWDYSSVDASLNNGVLTLVFQAKDIVSLPNIEIK